MDETVITDEQAEQLGGKLWEKGGMRRFYLNWPELIGLDVSYYNTGNISRARLNGERITNSEAYRMGAAKGRNDEGRGTAGKAWIADGKVHVHDMNERAEKLVREAVAAKLAELS